MAGPLALELIIPHLIEPAGGIEKETEGVLGDGTVVEAGTSGDSDLGSVEAGVEDVIGTGGEGLDPTELGQAADGIFEVIGGVGPGDEDLCVDMLLGDRSLDVVGLEGDGRESLHLGNVKLERSGVEELHFGGGCK